MRIVLEDPDGPGIFHAGERAAHARFGVQAQAREMQGTMASHLSAGNARFMASQPFFFASVREPDGAVFTQMLACVATAQGTYPLVAFDDAVNVSVELPIDRVSVDHGTAFDIAGKGIANHGNMNAAIAYARKLIAGGRA